jgi:hypothetical protein
VFCDPRSVDVFRDDPAGILQVNRGGGVEWSMLLEKK